MRHTITILDDEGRPATGKAVELYEWQSGSPYYGDKIGDFNEVPNLGEYYIEITGTIKGTILVNSVRKEAFTGIVLFGDFSENFLPDGVVITDQLADDAVTTAKLADGSVTPAKTTFAEDF